MLDPTEQIEIEMLDEQARKLFVDMLTLSYGRTQSWNSSSRGGERNPRPSGEADPMHEQWQDAYNKARTAQAKRQVLKDARRDLEQWRGHGIERPDVEVTPDKIRRWALIEGEGHDAQAVAIRFDTSATTVRKWRVSDGRDPEYGRTSRTVIEMHFSENMTVRQIALKTGLPKSTVGRMVKRRAA